MGIYEFLGTQTLNYANLEIDRSDSLAVVLKADGESQSVNLFFGGTLLLQSTIVLFIFKKKKQKEANNNKMQWKGSGLQIAKQVNT